MNRPLLLALVHLSEAHRELISRDYELLYAPSAAERESQVRERGGEVRVVLTNGTTGLTAAEIDAMPRLTLASALGAGYENLALDAARQRGIAASNGAGSNDDCVADHAWALLLAVVRAIPAQDRACRDGLWRDRLPLRPHLAGKRLGVLGLGTIGRKIARRGLAFEMQVGYHNRSRRNDAEHAYFDSVGALAEWCDCLVVATPGGAGTRHLVDAQVLERLGPHGYLVNIARGSVVDTAALAQALREGRVAGAALDVYESEPQPPLELLDLPGVVLTPHVAGWSPEAIDASVSLFLENARRHFAGEPLLTPI
ncbi:2-hydroxyacid dehydrogenase [Schlegelella sp. S2-27]|uniref:2-hydroxyacid dehydrogenase n=1 Tax=Caldimonas mangrovi TaxID=2944811 RepID=A0ABT0YNA8_9BURK|nr:2-hydroxyacid dehydrogenase [Caldimonas mangrovi]MCM5679742.1 2-hydroxyacid dehydrogenase [Caldimonas mangrovi]